MLPKMRILLLAISLTLIHVGVGQANSPTFISDKFTGKQTSAGFPANENGVYLIDRDVTLNEDIHLPSGCIIDFRGGCIKGNRTLWLNETFLTGKVKFQCKVRGSIENDRVNVKWFGAEDNGSINPKGYDSSKAFQIAIDFAEENNKELYVPTGYYGISKTLYVTKNKKCGIVGTESARPYIYALSSMDYMLTTKGDNGYGRKELRNLVFWGDNKSIGINDWHKYDCLAKYGCYFPDGYLYTRMSNVEFRFFSHWAFYANEIYDVHFNQIRVECCHNGIYLTGNVNGNSITESVFNKIMYFGIAANPSFMLTIERNIFEVVGCAAIVMGTGCNFVVRNNYFEGTCVDGFVPMYFDNSKMPQRLYADIITNGATVSRIIDWGQKNENPKSKVFARTYSVSGIIEANTFQKDVKKDGLNCLVFSTNLRDSKIRDNVLYNDRDLSNISVLGTCYKSNTSALVNVNVSNNVMSATPLNRDVFIKRFQAMEKSGTTSKSHYLMNITTDDIIASDQTITTGQGIRSIIE